MEEPRKVSGVSSLLKIFFSEADRATKKTLQKKLHLSGSPSTYMPHQGKREMERRRKRTG